MLSKLSYMNLVMSEVFPTVQTQQQTLSDRIPAIKDHTKIPMLCNTFVFDSVRCSLVERGRLNPHAELALWVEPQHLQNEIGSTSTPLSSVIRTRRCNIRQLFLRRRRLSGDVQWSEKKAGWSGATGRRGSARAPPYRSSNYARKAH